ncbi:hypothetical protein HDU93_001834, partial [Gonapodya sp. JEL0774]
RAQGDAIIIGASSLEHTKSNMADLDKGPLPETLLVELDRAWIVAKPTAANYFHP